MCLVETHAIRETRFGYVEFSSLLQIVLGLVKKKKKEPFSFGCSIIPLSLSVGFFVSLFEKILFQDLAVYFFYQSVEALLAGFIGGIDWERIPMKGSRN